MIPPRNPTLDSIPTRPWPQGTRGPFFARDVQTFPEKSEAAVSYIDLTVTGWRYWRPVSIFGIVENNAVSNQGTHIRYYERDALIASTPIGVLTPGLFFAFCAGINLPVQTVVEEATLSRQSVALPALWIQGDGKIRLQNYDITAGVDVNWQEVVLRIEGERAT